MRIVITRPVGDAPAWVDALQAAGYPALVLPLIEVGPVSNPQPVLDGDLDMFIEASLKSGL